jgi:hypothetical protein
VNEHLFEILAAIVAAAALAHVAALLVELFRNAAR